MDVLLYPVENLPLIEQTCIEVAACFNFLASEKTVDTDTIIESDNHQVVVSSSDESTSIGDRSINVKK
jgi:hypothetical protein